MFARIATTQSQPDQYEEIIRRIREQTVPVLQAQKGFRGFYGMVDRKSGKALGMSLWETEADERASLAAVARSRDQALQQAGITETTTVEVFEVTVQA